MPKFDSEYFVDTFSLRGVTKAKEYEALKKILLEHGLQEEQFGNDGYGGSCIQVKGTLLTSFRQHLEEMNDDENRFLTIETLFYNRESIAVYTNNNGDYSLEINERAFKNLPQHLILSPATTVISVDSNTEIFNPSISASSVLPLSVLRPAFVVHRRENPDYSAPDGSLITFLMPGQRGDKGDACTCKTPIGTTSKPVKHLIVQEIWVFTHGEGEFWLKKEGEEEGTIHEVKAGTFISIHPGVSFQFRNTSSDTVLEAAIVTMPPWPQNREEAVLVTGIWPPSLNSQNVEEAIKVDSQPIDSGILIETISTEAARPVSPSRVKGGSVFEVSVSTNTESTTLNVQIPSNFR